MLQETCLAVHGSCDGQMHCCKTFCSHYEFPANAMRTKICRPGGSLLTMMFVNTSWFSCLLRQLAWGLGEGCCEHSDAEKCRIQSCWPAEQKQKNSSGAIWQEKAGLSGENPQRAIKGGQMKEKFGSEEKWKERVKESWGGNSNVQTQDNTGTCLLNASQQQQQLRCFFWMGFLFKFCHNSFHYHYYLYSVVDFRFSSISLFRYVRA